MGSDETAITIPGGPRVIAYFTGTGRHRIQITRFFRGQIGSWRSLGVGLVVGSRLYRIRHRCGGLVLSESTGSKPCPIAATYLPNDLRNRRNLARGGYSSRPVPDLRGQARLRPPFTSFCTAGGDELARRGGSDRGGEVAWGPSCSTQPVEGRPVALRKAPAGGDRVWYRPPGTAPQGTRRARAQSNL